MMLRCCCVAMLVLAVSARAQDRPDPSRDVGIDQRLGARVPLDLELRDETGDAVRLAQYFGERPVILSLGYYRCPMLCSLVMNGLVRALKVLTFSVGDEVAVVTVSIDPEETAAQAAAKKEQYLASYARQDAASGWHFLTGDATAIERLTQAVGFRYRRDPQSGEYAHASAIMVLTPEGTVARYLFGVEYAPRDLRLALVEAAAGRIGSPIDQLLLLCLRYDPHTGRYSMMVMNTVRLAGIMTVVGVTLFVIVLRRRERRRLRVGVPHVDSQGVSA
jgi:protein SCO1/2